MENMDYNPLDLMDTKEIIEYLARNRFQASIIAGVVKDNSLKEIRVKTLVKGPKAEVEIVQMDINKQVNIHRGEND